MKLISETLAFGVVNIGVSILIGLFQGFLSGLVMFILIYTIIGLLQKWDNNVSIWNWFFDMIRISRRINN